MKKRDKNHIKKLEVKFRELPADALHQVKKLVDSAKEAAKEPEHVQR